MHKFREDILRISGPKGATIVELVVVMVILAIITIAAIIKIGDVVTEFQVATDASVLVMHLSYDQKRSVTDKARYPINFSSADSDYEASSLKDPLDPTRNMKGPNYGKIVVEEDFTISFDSRGMPEKNGNLLKNDMHIAVTNPNESKTRHVIIDADTGSATVD